MLGFSPGFAYLTGLPLELSELPRRPAPRPSVPAGSVALAGGFAAVYPQSTPGGWQVVGRTPSRLFDPRTPPYALLRPGDTVRFDPHATDRLGPAPVPAGPDRVPRRLLAPPPGHAAVLGVEEAGLLTTVQDGGRSGLAHLGVPGAGPADPLAHALANRLVGNPWAAPALEVTARGPVLRCIAPVHVAVVGADPEVTVDGREVGAGHVVPLAAGQRLTIGAVRAGLRCAVAVAGGLAVPGALGSCSTDLLCGLGPGPLVVGDVLGSGERRARWATTWTPARSGARRGRRGTWVLRVLPGPHGRWFPDDAFERLAGARFVVEAASDRVGVRLAPADGGAGVVRRPGELDSQGMVTGAVQVPPGGGRSSWGPITPPWAATRWWWWWPAATAGSSVSAGRATRSSWPRSAPGRRPRPFAPSAGRRRPRWSVATRRSRDEPPTPARDVVRGRRSSRRRTRAPGRRAMSKAKMRHPRQRPNAASRNAATASRPTRNAAGPQPATAQATTARVVSAAPIPWANRLGGPGVGRDGGAGPARRPGWPAGRGGSWSVR